MVNLLLTGKAVSNTFDDVIELDAGGKTKVIYMYWNLMIYKKFNLHESALCVDVISLCKCKFSSMYIKNVNFDVKIL